MGNVLGAVKAREVALSDGTTGLQTFELEDVRIWGVGVGVQDIAWRWQFRHAPSREWTDFAVTTHRIYTVLRVPTPPWTQEDYGPANIQLPWSEVLDHACSWAAGVSNPDDAAELVTTRVHDLGSGIVRYSGSAHYTDDESFACTSFLNRLRGGYGRGKRVNCDDCATIVSTFANAVGCDLFQSKIKATDISTFDLKPHFRIGISDRLLGRSFFYHQVASEGNCRVGDEVFDACVRVDADGDPRTPEVILATNLRFGNAVGDGYRFRLVTPAFEPLCVPQEGGCKRRMIGVANSLSASRKDLKAVLDEHAAFFSQEPYDGTGGHLFVSDFFFADSLLPGWRLVGLEESHGEVEHPASRSYWEGERQRGDILLRVDAYELNDRSETREGVLALLTRFQEPDMEPLVTPRLGDMAFTDAETNTVLFAVGNMIFFLRNVGLDSIPLLNIAQVINGAVSNPTPAAPFTPGPPLTVREFEFESEEATVDGDGVLIKERREDTLARRRFYQFLSSKGEVSRRDDRRLLYRPQLPGTNTLKIFAVDARGDALSQERHIQVRRAGEK
jgi:hypothetical protein